MMIRLNDRCHVAASEIAEVTTSTYGYITVRMKSGIGHSIDNDYGKGPYETTARLIAEINAILKVDAP